MITYMYTETDPDALEGTYLQGQLKGVTFKQLVDAFGQPERVEIEVEYATTDVEWSLQFHDAKDTLASVYNWKNGENYMGQEGQRVEDITVWNVGGHTPRALDRVREVLAAKGVSA